MSSTSYEVRGAAALIRLDYPPVNGLGAALRQGLMQALDRALADDAVKAIVVTVSERAFSGGADVKEFGTPNSAREPRLPALIAAFENSPKPVVAAVAGVCMGGGLELALGAHYRVAKSDAQIALPEVKLGLLPGAGGTQRLPRAIGLEAALLGKPVITLGESPVAVFPSATRIGDISCLPHLIRSKLAEVPPNRSEIVEAYAAYLAPFMRASHNDWRAEIDQQALVGYEELFDALRRYLMEGSSTSSRIVP
jgi:hypothetical protein